jgi:outer membrane protein OmpA-like peptidoglycan-associated protein
LLTNARAALDSISTEITKDTKSRYLIVGHANRTGPDDVSRDVSLQRAKVVASYLVQRGIIDRGRLQVEGRGAEFPLPAFDPSDGTQRRVEIFRIP